MRSRLRESAGFGIVDIMIYTALVTLIMLVVVSIFSSLFKAQDTVVSSGSAAESAQAASRSLESGIRNSTAVSVQTVIGANQLVLARTAGTGSTAGWVCSAWYFDATKSELRSTTSPTAIGAPTPSQLTGWQLLSAGVAPSSGSTVFTLTGNRLVSKFKVKATSTTWIPIESSVAVEAGSWLSAPCF